MSPAHRFFFAATLWITATSSFSAKLQDEKLGAAIEGVWCTSFDEGKTCWGYDEYRSGRITSCGGQTSTGVPSFVDGRYNIQGNRSCSFIVSSNEPAMKPGAQICIEILDIDQASMLFRYTKIENLDVHLNPENQNFDGGISLYRVSQAQMACRDAGR